jgi:hypothetical protein
MVVGLGSGGRKGDGGIVIGMRGWSMERGGKGDEMRS